MKIGDYELDGRRTYIVAEIGTCWAALNPERRLSSLWFHCEQAACIGADAVKVQMFIPDEPLFCPMEGDDERWPRWRNAFVAFEHWRKLKWECEAKWNVTLLASAFQPTAVEWLKELNVAAYKVASRAAATYPYDKVPGPFLVSTGQGIVVPNSVILHKKLVFLHCVPEYPTPLHKARWPRWPGPGDGRPRSGFSDHSGTVWPGLDAISRGCPLLEVHFAIGEFEGPDRAVSLNAEQLKLLCEHRDAVAQMRPH